MDKQRYNDQLEPVFNSSALIQDIAWNTFRERLTIETGGEKRSGRSVLAAQHDIYIYIYTLRKRIINLFPSCYAFLKFPKTRKKINRTSA